MLRILLTASMLLFSYSVFAAPPASDNSEQNKVDANDATLTPTDQLKGSEADVEATRALREVIVKQGDMSTYAKNIKIITLNGKTVLRGPVASSAERQRIATLARTVLGDRAVIENSLTISK